jgi:hypothetical protein
MNEKIALLKSELSDDLSRINGLYDRFATSWDRYAVANEYSLLVESAFTVNQLYTGIERMLGTIAGFFENNIDSDGWHKSLLERMRMPVEGLRPAAISEICYTRLDDLHAFRHYFRHAYDSDIRPEKFTIVAQSALALRESLNREIGVFMAFLGQLRHA